MFALLLVFSFVPCTLQLNLTGKVVERIPRVDFCLANEIQKSDISYYLFKGPNQEIAININENYAFPEDDRKKPTKLLIHSHRGNCSTPWFKLVKDRYFKLGPHNIIYVDWHNVSNRSFPVASANIKPGGEAIGDFLTAIKVPLRNIHIIAHGLSAHMAGFIGRRVILNTGRKIGRISGVGPTGPGFQLVSHESRLSKYDAEFVDVIHTDIDFFALKQPAGHADFYPNDGGRQPGCKSRKRNPKCNYYRSLDYFIESIGKKDVMATKVMLDEVGRVIPAHKPAVAEFGDSMPWDVRGMFRFTTNASAPFLKEKRITVEDIKKGKVE